MTLKYTINIIISYRKQKTLHRQSFNQKEMFIKLITTHKKLYKIILRIQTIDWI